MNRKAASNILNTIFIFETATQKKTAEYQQHQQT